MFEEFGPSLWVADGPTVSFYGFPYPTRMAVARLSDGSAWVWSPVALTRDLVEAVEAIGPVGHIVSPNKLFSLLTLGPVKVWRSGLTDLPSRPPKRTIDAIPCTHPIAHPLSTNEYQEPMRFSEREPPTYFETSVRDAS